MPAYKFNDVVLDKSEGTLKIGWGYTSGQHLTAPFGIRIGDTIGSTLPTGNFCIGIGQRALDAGGSGSSNIAIGVFSQAAPASGSFNVAVGTYSLYSNTTGYLNTCVGQNILYSNTTGFSNTAVGTNALYSNVTGSYNVSLGQDTLRGGNNTQTVAIGYQSGYNTTAIHNCFIGMYTGYYVASGSGNTYLGANIYDSQEGANTNNTIIGANTTGYGAVSSTVIISDGANSKNIIADTNSVRFNRPVVAKSYTVATLPSATTSGVGAISYATNGRRAGQAAGAGSGCPVYSDGTNWRTYYDNSVVAA